MIILNVTCSSGPFKPLMRKKTLYKSQQQNVTYLFQSNNSKVTNTLSLELLSQYQKLYRSDLLHTFAVI